MEKKCALTGGKLDENLQENDCKGVGALREKTLKCSEYLSVRQKVGNECLQNLIYPGEVGQTYSRLEKRK